MKKILLTGFEPFGGIAVNPSQVVVERIATRSTKAGTRDLVIEILPTEFFSAGWRIRELIRLHRPDKVICLGVGRNSAAIQLERIALNLDDADLPDNAGAAPHGAPIIIGAPLAYRSTLPIEQMTARLRSRGIPALISNHAGTYVCNHAFYLARHELELLGVSSPCGFIHLPPLPEAKEAARGGIGLSLETMVEAIELCLDFENE